MVSGTIVRYHRPGTARKLQKHAMFTLGDVAMAALYDEGQFYKMFGIDAEIEDYGAFSSSCPGYGKHHSGDVEAAFLKSISCSLSSKGCKHR